MDMETKHIRVDKTTHKKLKREAIELSTSIAELATEIINDYLAGNTEHYAINRSEIQAMSENVPTIRWLYLSDAGSVSAGIHTENYLQRI